MIKLAGHTMGTPKKDLVGSMRFFREIGYEGIEIRVAPDGYINPEAYTPAHGRGIARQADDLGIAVCCLTSYYRDFATPEKCRQEVDGLKRIADMAAQLGCPLIRALGGFCGASEKRPEIIRERTVAALRQVADHAAPLGVKLAIETHVGYLCLTAGDTADFVRDIDHPGVGILLDYSWVHYAAKETAAQALQAVKPYLLHCHAKDWKYLSDDRDDRRTVLMGEGDIDWPALIPLLKASGYSGYISDEYEKYWQDYLPEPEIGMAHNARYLRDALHD